MQGSPLENFGDALAIHLMDIHNRKKEEDKMGGPPCSYKDPLDVWQSKIRLLRMKAQRWPLKVNSKLREDKHLFENLQLSDVEADRIKHVLLLFCGASGN